MSEREEQVAGAGLDEVAMATDRQADSVSKALWGIADAIDKSAAQTGRLADAMHRLAELRSKKG